MQINNVLTSPFYKDGDNDDSDDDDEGDDENELDKQMGDVGDEEADKLDEQVWGSDQEEEEEEEQEEQVSSRNMFISKQFPTCKMLFRKYVFNLICAINNSTNIIINNNNNNCIYIALVS